MEFIEELQRTVRNCVQAMDMLDVGYATVISPSPLTLMIQATQLTVGEPVAVMSDNVRYRDVVVQGQTVIINPGLKAGDKVLVLKANAGQNYIVISRV